MKDQKKTRAQLEDEVQALRQRVDHLERMEAESRDEQEALRESKQRCRSIIEAFDGFIYICSRDHRIEFMNERLIERAGYDATGEPCYRVLHDLDTVCRWCVNEKVFTGETIRQEVLSPKDNHWYYVINTPIVHPDGSVSKLALVLDITERKLAEEKLRESEEKYRLLVLNLPGMVFRGYQDWSVEFIGKEVEELTGYSAEDFNSGKMKWSDVLLEKDIEASKDIFVQALKTDRSYVRDYRIKTRSGKLLWIQERGQIVCDEAGEIQYVDGVFFDITQQKNSGEALRKSSEKFKLFASSVMHDLKSPAVGIRGLADLLHRQYSDSLDQKGKTYCNQILKASEHLAALVEKINSYIAAKESALKIEKIEVKDVLRSIREQFSPRLAERGVEWSEPEVLPEIHADKLSLTRIFSNLVENALKYGGEDLSEIRIGYEEAEKFHIFSVSDDGAGLEESDVEKIFSVFEREEAAGETEGAGLGLTIVKELAEHHGGKVWVEPGEEKGTVFYISVSKTH
ncbi:MAG: sensor histidine kinase [Syntrophobacteria bacterium]